MPTEKEKTYKRSDRVAWRIIEGAAVIVTPDDGMAHRLNETATWMWETLAEPSTIAKLAGRMTDEFDVASEAALADVREFIDKLLLRGIVLEAG